MLKEEQNPLMKKTKTKIQRLSVPFQGSPNHPLLISFKRQQTRKMKKHHLMNWVKKLIQTQIENLGVKGK